MVCQALLVGSLQELNGWPTNDVYKALVGVVRFLSDCKFSYISTTPIILICTQSLVGCIVSYLTSCPDFAASLSKGECSGPRSVRGQLASLYTSYALDVLSNLMSAYTI